MYIWWTVWIIAFACAIQGQALLSSLHGHRRIIKQTSSSYTVTNMPNRFQWFNNKGYCGETSLICAGLKYGQYVSQYTVRQTIGSQADDQVLLGINDNTAADALHLQYVQFTSSAGNTNQFLTWVKAYILNDHPVIIGIYTNECLFHQQPGCYCGGSSSVCGDPEYDHIVPVVTIQSTDLTVPTLPPPPYPTYDSNDVITFSDNGLEGPYNNPTNSPCGPNPANPYWFSYTFDGFQNDRKQANNPQGQWYSLGDEVNNYAIAILGVKDLDHDTIPVTVVTNVGTSSCPSTGYLNYEFPEIVDGFNTQPAPLTLSLEVTVTILDPSQSYHLYYYNDLAKIPDSAFNSHASDALQSWTIAAHSGSTYQVSVTIQSDQVAAFRAVSTTAP